MCPKSYSSMNMWDKYLLEVTEWLQGYVINKWHRVGTHSRPGVSTGSSRNSAGTFTPLRLMCQHIAFYVLLQRPLIILRVQFMFLNYRTPDARLI